MYGSRKATAGLLEVIVTAPLYSPAEGTELPSEIFRTAEPPGATIRLVCDGVTLAPVAATPTVTPTVRVMDADPLLLTVTGIVFGKFVPVAR
jgi:hypothetical protein